MKISFSSRLLLLASLFISLCMSAKCQTQWIAQGGESFGSFSGPGYVQTVSGLTEWGRSPSVSFAGCSIQCTVRQVYFCYIDGSRTPYNDYSQWQRSQGGSNGSVNWSDTSQYWYKAWLNRPVGAIAVVYKIEVRSTAFWLTYDNFLTDYALSSGEFIYPFPF